MKKESNLLVSGLAILLMSICFGTNAYSQKINAIPITTAVTDYQNQTFNNVSFHDLILGMQSTTYLSNGVIENPADNVGTPIKLHVDASSLHLLNQNLPGFDDIVVLEIKIKSSSELALLRTISSFNNLPALKVIYISCSYLVCGSNGTEACQKQTIGNNMNEISFPGLITVYSSYLEN